MVMGELHGKEQHFLNFTLNFFFLQSLTVIR